MGDEGIQPTSMKRCAEFLPVPSSVLAAEDTAMNAACFRLTEGTASGEGNNH